MFYPEEVMSYAPIELGRRRMFNQIREATYVEAILKNR
jgi:hypothetical protein